MESIFRAFVSNTSRFRTRSEHVLNSSYSHSFESTYLTSQIISEIWLSWCRFCRDLIIASCNGSATRSGTLIQARSMNNTPERLAYEFKQYKFGNNPRPSGVITQSYNEPTWGDVSAMLTVLPGLNPSNLSSLLSGFGLSLQGPQHLQITRNTISHLSADGVRSFKQILVFYAGVPIRHPSDLIRWKDPSKNTEVIFSWIDDLETIASTVTS
jgi:hypothetical protein